MQSWSARQRAPSAQEWTRVREILREAHAFDPAQPAYLEDLGRLYEVRAVSLPSSDSLAREFVKQALAYQREALKRRPGSPYTWSNIALLKSRLAEPDAEFAQALRNAALLGPWEPVVQVALADAGLSQWPKLDAPSREALRANLARAVRWQDETIFNIARRTGRLDVLCAVPETARSPRAIACI